MFFRSWEGLVNWKINKPEEKNMSVENAKKFLNKMDQDPSFKKSL